MCGTRSVREPDECGMYLYLSLSQGPKGLAYQVHHLLLEGGCISSLSAFISTVGDVFTGEFPSVFSFFRPFFDAWFPSMLPTKAYPLPRRG